MNDDVDLTRPATLAAGTFLPVAAIAHWLWHARVRRLAGRMPAAPGRTLTGAPGNRRLDGSRCDYYAAGDQVFTPGPAGPAKEG